MKVTALFWGSVLAATLGGCDGGSPPPPPDNAAGEKDELDAETKARIAERKAKREAEAKAKAEAEAKLAAEIERLCVVPDKFEKDFVKACEAVGQAHDAFVRKQGPEEIEKWDGGGSERQIPMTVVQCTQADSTEVAACQKNALDNLGPEMKDYTKDFLQACIDKYASKKPRKGGMPPKRRPG